MRYAVTPRWVYVMLIVMGVGFMAGAGAFVLFVPPPTGAIVGGIWLLMGAGFVFFSLRALAQRRANELIAHTGAAATATVLSANTTGMIINNVPQWALQLRIDGYGASYETKLKLQTYSPPPNGATFSVRVDPAKREHVVMADDGATAGRMSTAAVTNAAGAASFPPGVQSAILDALRQAGVGDPGATTTTTNPDGSRTITMTTIDAGDAHDAGTPRNAAQTVKLLAELDSLRASGALAQSEFDTIKAKLLGERPQSS